MASRFGLHRRHRAATVFGLAFERVRDNYLDKPEDRTLVENASTACSPTSTRNSSYFDPDTYAAMETKAAGAYGGVGLVITVPDGVAKVVQVVPATPAARGGVKAGDILTAVDGTPLRGLKLDEVSQRLARHHRTAVTLTIARAVKKPFDLKLMREAIEVERLTYKREAMSAISRSSPSAIAPIPDLRAAVTDLKRQIGPALKGYVIDLRDNGGGVLQSSIDGPTISSMPARSSRCAAATPTAMNATCPSRRHRRRQAGGRDRQWRHRLGVGDRGRRAAGSCARHHSGHALLRQGFGADGRAARNGAGGALHMTTGRYYTPSGRSIQVTGIVPDIVVSAARTRRNISARSRCRII